MITQIYPINHDLFDSQVMNFPEKYENLNTNSS